MRTLFVPAAIVCLLLAGCGGKSGNSSKNNGKSDKARAEEAARAKEEAAAWQPPEVPAKPPPRTDFSDIDDAWTVLAQAAVDMDTNQTWAAIRWLAAKRAPAAERMTSIMNDRSARLEHRLAACMVLGEMGTDARDILLTALQSSDSFRVRVRAAEDLGKMKPPAEQTIDVLCQLLDDDDNRVRIHVAKALGEIGEPAARAAKRLNQIRDDVTIDDQMLRDAAHHALKKVHPRRTLTDRE